MAVNAKIDDLVEQVGNLTEATTELLDATQVSKQNLDKAETTTVEAAKRAESAAKTATKQTGEAITSASEAKKSEQNALAVTHNDEGSLEPKAGAYPVADSKGQLDIGWTPHLAALYPYSGIMGSIDKNDLFRFAQSSSDSNKIFWQRLKTYKFNIAGRFVGFTAPSSWEGCAITLPEAESTPERAIAFDDIFLDWNGTITPYRSITPHRTATTFDRDAIAAEHGYSKAQTGLYKNGENYALLLCRVARRNQGAYHPVWNPEGAGTVYFSDAAEARYPWYITGRSKEIKNVNDCFKIGGYEDSIVPLSSGKITPGFSGRPGARKNGGTHSLGGIWFYDAIYADDITPLYYSAEKIQDRHSLNRAVAGCTFGGAEGTKYSPELVNQQDYKKSKFNSVTSTITITNDSIKSANSQKGSMVGIEVPLPFGANIEISCECTEYTSGIIDFIVYGDGSYDGRVITIDRPGKYSYSAKVGDQTSDYGGTNKILIYQSSNSDTGTFTLKNISIKVSQQQPSARPQFLACDIIGSLDTMPSEWKKEGIPGNCLAVGEEGESLVPDRTEKNYKLSRKCSECYLALQTTDSGKTWIDVSYHWKTAVEKSSNARIYDLAPSSVTMIFYKTSANPFELTAKSKPLSFGQNAWSSTSNNNYQSRAAFVSNLINKIPTNSGIDEQTRGMKNLVSASDEGLYVSQKYEHDAFNSVDSDSPRCKVFSFISASDDVCYLTVIYKEMKQKDGQSGDDNAFNVVDYQSTVTDLNGEEIIVGQKRVELLYQFDGNTY